MRSGIAANVLGVVGVLGIALKIALVVPRDPTLGTWEAPYLLFGLLNVIVGWVLARRRPRIVIGWLLLATGVVEFLQGPAVALSGLTHGSAAGWALEFGPRSAWSWVPVLGTLFILVPLRFPTGSLPTPRWRTFWRACIVALVVDSILAATVERTNGYGIPSPTHVAWGGGSLAIVMIAVIGSLAAAMLTTLVSLILRYRRGTSVERAQLRWYFSALAVVALTLVISGIENAIFGDEYAPGIFGTVANAIDAVSDLAYCLLPIAILVAVLRAGLYSIDRIISRTAAYSVVTVCVVAVYSGVVLLGSLLPGLPSVGVALATLAAAAVFLPLLRVVRRRVDRRFNRAQYDAEKVVDAFGERVRTGADPHSAGEDLVSAVGIALQPSAIGIWRREDAR